MATPRGSVRIASIGGVPVFVHWTVAALAGVIVVLSGFDPIWSLCSVGAYALLLAAHEFGHFGAARWYGLTVSEVHFRGLDAHCRIQAPRTTREAVWVYAGGVIAQAVLLVVAVGVLVVFDPPRGPVADSAFRIFGILNALMIVQNLWPTMTEAGHMSDGYVIRQVLRQAQAGITAPFTPVAAPTRLFPPSTRLLTIEGFAPAGFTHGVEILNDETTPMDYVVDSLTRHLHLEHDLAVAMMLSIHRDGGVLHPLLDPGVAAATAAAMACDAAANGHALVCRAVHVTTWPGQTVE